MAYGSDVLPATGESVPVDVIGGLDFPRGKLALGSEGVAVDLNGDATGGLWAQGAIAHDGADTGNPLKVGGKALSADPVAVATGDRVNALFGLLGKLVVLPRALPGQTWQYAGATAGLVTTADVTVKAAGAAGERQYVTSIQMCNTHATISTEIVIKDGAGGTVIWRGYAKAVGEEVNIAFDPPLRGSAATLVAIAEITQTATNGVVVSLQGYTAAE